MGYALKLENVDFSSVAVAKVNFEDAVHCTGLSLDKQTLTFVKVGDTSQITATKTPADTTDILTWASSNENVATVDSTGLVTIHGIGSATITATCGEQTATASIAQTTIRAQYDYVVLNDKSAGEYSGVLCLQDQSGQSVGAQAYHNDDAVRMRFTTDVECIPVPYGASKMKFATTDGESHSVNYMEIVDNGTLVTIGDDKFPSWSSHPSFVNSNTGANVEYGQAFAFRGQTSNIESVSYVYFE